MEVTAEIDVTTKEAFQHFIDNVYPDIKPKDAQLRLAVTRFKKEENLLSEDKMIEILIQHGYQAKTFRAIPETWVGPKS